MCSRALSRHAGGDWGDCGPEDWKEERAFLEGRLPTLSVYHDQNGVKFWIITEADRSATTVLLPEDYLTAIGTGTWPGPLKPNKEDYV